MQEKISATPNIFADRLRIALRHNGLNQVDLHKTLGFAQSTISRWKGGSAPRGATLIVLAGKLGVSPSWLVGESDEETFVPTPPVDTSEQTTELGEPSPEPSADFIDILTSLIASTREEDHRRLVIDWLKRAESKGRKITSEEWSIVIDHLYDTMPTEEPT